MSWNSGLEEEVEDNQQYIVLYDCDEPEFVTGKEALKKYIQECINDGTEISAVYEIGKEVQYNVEEKYESVVTID